MSFTIISYRLYDTADEIALDKVESMLSADGHVSRLHLTRVSPKSIAFKNPPVTVELPPHFITLAKKTYEATVRARIYDLGVISIILRITLPDDTDYEHIKDIAVDIDNIDEPSFIDPVKSIMKTIRPAIKGEHALEFDEDFTVYYCKHWQADWDAIPLLLSDKNPVSPETRRETLSNKLSYGEDFTILTWDRAIVCDPTGSPDIPELLEFANAQFLELRYYDHLLDKGIDKMYEAITEANIRAGYRKLGHYRRIRRQLLELMADVAAITGRIHNALRVTEDVFYARVYSLNLKLLRVNDWKESIENKIDVIQHTYNFLSEEVVTRRSELMEMGVILLIAIEIVLSLLQFH